MWCVLEVCLRCEFVYKMIFQEPLKTHLLATAMQRSVQIVFIFATDLRHQCVQVCVCVRGGWQYRVYACAFACINFVLHTIAIESYVLRWKYVHKVAWVHEYFKWSAYSNFKAPPNNFKMMQFIYQTCHSLLHSQPALVLVQAQQSLFYKCR